MTLTDQQVAAIRHEVAAIQRAALMETSYVIRSMWDGEAGVALVAFVAYTANE